MAYNWDQIGGQIDNLLGSGNEAQAWAMFNGLSGMGNAQGAGGFAGGLDSYLRTRWGDEKAKQWVNNMDTKYGNTLMDPKTGQWAGMGQAAGQTGTIAGWNPADYNPGGMGVPGGYAPAGYGSGAGGFAGSTGAPAAAPAPGATPPAAGAPPASAAPATPNYQASSYAAPTRAASAGSPFDFMNDAGYQFRLREGMNGIKGDAAAGGMLQSGKTLKALSNYNQGLASQEYENAFNRYTNTRDFNENQFRNDRDFGRANYQDDRNFNRGAYQNDRDYNRGVFQNDRDYGENRRRWDLGFGEDQRRNDRDFDFMFGKDQRDYETGLDRYNNEWGYNTGVNDRNWQTNTLMQLAQMGLGATGSSGGLAQSLSNLFSGNTLAGANAGAAGTVGGANNINSMISQLMQYLQGQQMLNAIGGGRVIP